MSTTSELIDAYTKAFNGDYLKNMQVIQAGLEATYKSITGNDAYKQMQAWQKVLNDPESSINKSMRMWSEFSKKIDYEKLTGIQAGLQQLTFQMPKIDMSAFEGLQTNLGKLLNTENIINSKLSEAIEYAYETAREEAGEPDISKEELQNVVREEIENDAPVIYEIHNENTYVNIIDQTDKKYRVFFIDDDGNVIDGYTDKENIDMNFEDEE